MNVYWGCDAKISQYYLSNKSTGSDILRDTERESESESESESKRCKKCFEQYVY